MFQDLFAIPIPILEKVLRPALVYLFLVLLLRVFGKRELAQLNPFDLVVLLSLSNTVQNAMIGNDNSLAGGLIGATSLLLINYLVVRFVFRHRRLDEILEGEPTVLVRDGVIDEKALASELMTGAELNTVARRQGFDGAADLESCILEPGGAFAMKRKHPSEEERIVGALNARLDIITAELRALHAKIERPGDRPTPA